MKEAKDRGLIGHRAAMKVLGVSRSTLQRLIREKEIEAEYIEGFSFFDPEMLKEVNPDSLEGGEDDGRAYVLDWALAALEQSESHKDAMVKLSYEGPRSTIDALLKENQSLRDRCHRYDQTVAEMQLLYNQLLRETMLSGIEAEKEKNKLEMQKEAFDFLKTKLAPIMLDNLGASKFIESFSLDQIEAFIESGAATEAQSKALKKELEKRKAAQKKQAQQKEKGTPNVKTQPDESRQSVSADSPQ